MWLISHHKSKAASWIRIVGAGHLTKWPLQVLVRDCPPAAVARCSEVSLQEVVPWRSPWAYLDEVGLPITWITLIIVINVTSWVVYNVHWLLFFQNLMPLSNSMPEILGNYSHLDVLGVQQMMLDSRFCFGSLETFWRCFQFWNWAKFPVLLRLQGGAVGILGLEPGPLTTCLLLVSGSNSGSFPLSWLLLWLFTYNEHFEAAHPYATCHFELLPILSLYLSLLSCYPYSACFWVAAHTHTVWVAAHTVVPVAGGPCWEPEYMPAPGSQLLVSSLLWSSLSGCPGLPYVLLHDLLP